MVRVCSSSSSLSYSTLFLLRPQFSRVSVLWLPLPPSFLPSFLRVVLRLIISRLRLAPGAAEQEQTTTTTTTTTTVTTALPVRTRAMSLPATAGRLAFLSPAVRRQRVGWAAATSTQTVRSLLVAPRAVLPFPLVYFFFFSSVQFSARTHTHDRYSAAAAAAGADVDNPGPIKGNASVLQQRKAAATH